MQETITHPGDFPAPRAFYSPAVLIETGDTSVLFATGQLAIDNDGKVVVP